MKNLPNLDLRKLYFHFRKRSNVSFFLKRVYCSEVSETEKNKLEVDFPDDLIDTFKPFDEAGRVFVVHPYIKWGREKEQKTTPDLQLEEAITLAKTLPEWTVQEHRAVGLLSFKKKSVFNKGQLEKLRKVIKINAKINGVFINIKSLSISQHCFLESLFEVPVFDRYSVVINIFKLFARSKEAKLQVALAEIPYVRSRLRGIYKTNVFSSEEFNCSSKMLILSLKEKKIKSMIESLHKRRDLLRNKREQMEFPTVAIVGYTNAGKTSLIKSLTQDVSLNPMDRLFATLDVTFHLGLLNSRMKVLYADTIGFISDIPTKLLLPFVTTLKDALNADLIVHVRDLSHPDTQNQHDLVMKTLDSFNLQESLLKNMITVGNKIDKIETSLFNKLKNENSDMILCSCTENIGLLELKNIIENKLINSIGLLKYSIRVRNGGYEFSWLHKNSTILNFVVDINNFNYIVLTVLISRSKIGQFKKMLAKEIGD